MPDKKHHVFSARTTGEGLKALNEIRREKGVSWDELVIGAVCAHYRLDKGAMTVPKPVKAEKQGKTKPRDKRTGATKAKEEAGTST